MIYIIYCEPLWDTDRTYLGYVYSEEDAKNYCERMRNKTPSEYNIQCYHYEEVEVLSLEND